MNKPQIRKVTTTHIQVSLAGGFRSPQINIQITPLHWGLCFVLSYVGKRPLHSGLKVGPISVSIFFGSADFETQRECHKTASHVFEKVD